MKKVLFAALTAAFAASAMAAEIGVGATNLTGTQGSVSGVTTAAGQASIGNGIAFNAATAGNRSGAAVVTTGGAAGGASVGGTGTQSNASNFGASAGSALQGSGSVATGGAAQTGSFTTNKLYLFVLP